MSPARTTKQRKAAGAELSRRRRGLRPKNFEGMSEDELTKMASKKHKRTRGALPYTTPE